MNIRVIVTGRSYHTATSLPDVLELPEEATIQSALDQIGAMLPEESALPKSCLIALSGQHVGSIANFEDRQLSDGQELTLVAPVAGG